jgi:hypothetical protein
MLPAAIINKVKAQETVELIPRFGHKVLAIKAEVSSSVTGQVFVQDGGGSI